MRFPGRILFAALFCFAAAPLACAQVAGVGAISGRVVDATGAAVPNANITLTDMRTGQTRTAAAGPQGEFRVDSLSPDTWQVKAASAGFAESSAQVSVAPSATAEISITLSVRTATEIVTVPAEAQLQTLTAEEGAIVSVREVDELPANAQRWQTFALLAPTSVLDPETNEVSFHAVPSTTNLETLDGFDDSRAFAAGENTRSRIATTVSQAAVREFHVLTGGYGAGLGRATGGVVDTVTRSGGEHLHGELRYNARDSDWTSNAPDTAVLLPQPDGTLNNVADLPRDLRQQVTARIGGPIPRSHAFWHLTFDREHRGFPAIGTVTSAPGLFFSQALPGDLTGFEPQGASCPQEIYTNGQNGRVRGTGTETAAGLYGTQGACFLNLFDSTDYPSYAQAAAAYNNGLAYLYSLTGETPRSRDTTLLSPLADRQFGRTHMLVAYHRARSESYAGADDQPFVTRSISSLGNDGLRSDRGSISADTVLTPRLVNSLRAGLGHQQDYQSRQAPLPQEPLTALGGTAPPGVDITRQFFFGTESTADRTAYPEEYRLQVADTVSLSRGGWSAQAGVEWQHINDHVQQLLAEAGDYHYADVQDFLIDNATVVAIPAAHCGESGTAQHSCYSHYVQGFGAPGASFTTNDWAAFVQAQWRIAPRLTLNAGLRYDTQRLPPASLPSPLLSATTQRPADRNNFGPRLGMAWQPIADTVLRAGAGVYYATTPATAMYNAQIATGTTASQQVLDLSVSTGAPRYPYVLSAPPPPADLQPPDVTVFAQNFRQPQVLLFNLDVQHRWRANTVFSLGGIAALGREFPITVDTNLNTPAGTVTYDFTGGPLNGVTWQTPVYTGERPDPNFGAIHTLESRANSRYTGLVAEVRHRAAAQLEFRAAYTWSHAMDDGQRSRVTGTSNQVLSPDDFALQRGTSSLDRRNRVAGSAVWEPRFAAAGWRDKLANGWLAAPVLQLAGGAPYSARMIGVPPGGAPDYRTSYGYLGAGGDDFLPLLGRNRYLQPATAVVDLRVARQIALPRTTQLQFSASLFNLLNRTNVSGSGERAAVDEDAYLIGSGQAAGQPVLATYRPTFGSVVEQDAHPLFGSRQLELSARLRF